MDLARPRLPREFFWRETRITTKGNLRFSQKKLGQCETFPKKGFPHLKFLLRRVAKGGWLEKNTRYEVAPAIFVRL